MAFGITDLKKGIVFQWEGEPFRVVDYNQKVMGRGGSIVNVRIKLLKVTSNFKLPMLRTKLFSIYTLMATLFTS